MIKDSLEFLLKLFLTSGMLLILILFIPYFLQKENLLIEIIFGYLGSSFIFTLGFMSICWSLKKPIKTFMWVVFGGMFVRFLLLALLVFLIMKYSNLNIVYFIISFVAYYIFYQFVEIKFINKNVNKEKKWGLTSSRVL